MWWLTIYFCDISTISATELLLNGIHSVILQSSVVIVVLMSRYCITLKAMAVWNSELSIEAGECGWNTRWILHYGIFLTLSCMFCEFASCNWWKTSFCEELEFCMIFSISFWCFVESSSTLEECDIFICKKLWRLVTITFTFTRPLTHCKQTRTQVH